MKKVALVALTILSLSVSSVAGADTNVIAQLKALGTSVFAGYSDVSSDINRVLVADAVCQALGFSRAGDYSDGWSATDKSPLLFLTYANGKLRFVKEAPESGRSAARFTELNCK